MYRSVLVWMAVALGAATALAEEGLLFRASFDQGATAELAQGGGEPVYLSKVQSVAGRIGQAAHVPAGGQLIYEGLGNARVEAGTVTVFWRIDDESAGESFTILDLSPIDRVNYSRWLRLSLTGNVLSLYATLGHAGPVEIRSGNQELQKGQWRHLALAWDQTRGAGVYLDGQLVAHRAGTWVYQGQVNHIGLAVTSRPDFRPGGADFGQSFDELRVYDYWLDDAKIAALASAAAITSDPPSFSPYLEQRRRTYGWTTLDDGQMPELRIAPDAEGIGLRQVGVAKARDVARTAWRTFDGERGRSWPGGVGYRNGGESLDITLFPGQSLDVIQLYGAGPLRLVDTRNEANPLLDVASKGLGHTRVVLSRPVRAEQLALRREAGCVYELNLFQTTRFDLGDAGWRTTSVRSPGEADEQTAELAILRRIYGRAYQTALLADDSPKTVQTPGIPAPATVSSSDQPQRMVFPAMRAVHILGSDHPDRQGLTALALDLAVLSGGVPNALRVDVIDPLNDVRFAATADVRLGGAPAGRLRLLLDLRDMVMRPGARPHITVTFRDDVEIDTASSVIQYRFAGVADAMAEHSADQLARAKDIFQEISESRPWGHPPAKLKTLGMLRNIVDELHSLRPGDPVIASYWHWIHPREQKPLSEPPATREDLPAWAVYMDAAIELLKQVPYWWIDNRENGAGEFGANDGINDDTDLVQDWWAMHLMRGPDPKLFGSLKRTADVSWRVTMRETGLGHYSDTLHTMNSTASTWPGNARAT